MHLQIALWEWDNLFQSKIILFVNYFEITTVALQIFIVYLCYSLNITYINNLFSVSLSVKLCVINFF